jgi:hypothetical protein
MKNNLTEDEILKVALDKYPIKNVPIGSNKIVDQNNKERNYFIEGAMFVLEYTKSDTRIDINQLSYYQHGKPELKERTKSRLIQLNDMCMTEVGIAEFGIKGVVSGLVIEQIWNHSDHDWSDHIEWMKSVIDEKLTK